MSHLENVKAGYQAFANGDVEGAVSNWDENIKWIAGPNEGADGSVDYRSRKIGDKMYLVNFHEPSNSTFVTIVFNFNQNVISTSAIIAPNSDRENIIFEGGIIENLKLKEN